MNLPNKLTLLRAVLVPFMIAAFYIQIPVFKYVTAAIFLIAAFTDFLDGYIARKNDLVTDFGKFMDPLADKALVLCALIIIVDGNIIDIPYLAAICLAVNLIRELAVSALRMLAATKGTVIAADKLGKYKTFTQDIAIVLLFIAAAFHPDFTTSTFASIVYYGGVGMLVVSTLIAIISGINYLSKNKTVFAETK